MTERLNDDSDSLILEANVEIQQHLMEHFEKNQVLSLDSKDPPTDSENYQYNRYLNNGEHDTIKIGKLIISLKKLRLSLLPKPLQRQFLQRVRKLANKKWHEILFEGVKISGLPYVEQFRIEKLDLNEYVSELKSENKKFTKIPQQMIIVNLPELLQLNLSKQEISNIEALTFMNAPKLKTILLMRNKISNINSFVKSSFPQLKEIILYQNPIILTENFYRLQSSQLTIYNFDSSIHTEFMIEDLRFLLKLQPTEMRKAILLRNPQRKKLRYQQSFFRLGQQKAYISMADRSFWK